MLKIPSSQCKKRGYVTFRLDSRIDKLELPRSVAIPAADAVGYSRLMSINDTPQWPRWTRHALSFASIEANRGRVIDMAGDSVLAVFETAPEAVRTALAAQNRLEGLDADKAEDSRLIFRVGVHLGDVIEKADGTVYGDGVNIAARLEGLSEPGGITVSEAIRSVVGVRASFEDQGEKSVKNVADPVRAWRVAAMTVRPIRRGAAASASPRASFLEMPWPCPTSRPSRCSFINMSGDATGVLRF